MVDESQVDKAQTGETKTIKIRHDPSPHFISAHASGSILSGPSPDGLMFLTFFTDMINVRSETGTPLGDGEFSISFVGEDVEHYVREDKAKISMTEQSLRALYSTLHNRFKGKTS